MKHIAHLLVVMTFGFLFNGCKPEEKKSTSQTLYFNGSIITMEGDEPIYAEALVTDSSRIVFIGKLAEAEKQFEGATRRDLGGQTLLPGFMDAHGHAWMAGLQRMSANLLAPPDGPITDIKSLQNQLNEWTANNQDVVKKIGWIIGFGYDDAQLAEQRHPTASELDVISSEIPVVIIHQSSHLFSVNHKALQMAGIDANTPNPGGGIIRREADGKTPNGVLEEMAGITLLYKHLLGNFDEEDNIRLSLDGLKAYSEFGFTTVQEGRANATIAKTWTLLAQQKKVTLDVAVYPDIYLEQPYLKGQKSSGEYTDRVRLAGIKMSLDGSPQGRTAWLTKPYKVPPDGQNSSYAGYPAFANSRVVDSLVFQAYRNNWQILAHCNGDAAIEAFINSIEKANTVMGKQDRRPVIIHSQVVRFDQLDRMKAEGIIPSFFSLHTFYWGDWHRDVTLGKERAYRISPTATTLQKGMIFTQHHDAPVALPSSIMILHTTVNRVSRSGDIIGPDERIGPYQALKSITAWAAYQYFEEGTKGTLAPGKLADLVILDQNPLTIEPMKIKDITVLETIKEGQTVYKK